MSIMCQNQCDQGLSKEFTLLDMIFDRQLLSFLIVHLFRLLDILVKFLRPKTMFMLTRWTIILIHPFIRCSGGTFLPLSVYLVWLKVCFEIFILLETFTNCLIIYFRNFILFDTFKYILRNWTLHFDGLKFIKKFEKLTYLWFESFEFMSEKNQTFSFLNT